MRDFNLLLRTNVLGIASIAVLLMQCGNPRPISLLQRDSLVDEGKVLIVLNSSDDYVHECSIGIERPGGEVLQPVVFAVTLPPHTETEVGWLELPGWTLQPGDKVTVSCRGYPEVSAEISE